MRQIALMFSGGVDSTTAAVRLAERYDRVHLLTYDNGYWHTHIDRTRRRVEELRRRVGDRFVHEIASVRDLFELVLSDPQAEFQRYGSGFVWCLGCKTAMHTRSILYNLEHGIGELADGSSGSTGEMVEQMPLSLELGTVFDGRHGIAFGNPIYDIPRSQEIEELRKRGFRMGLRIGDRFLGTQPKCRPGLLYYLPYLLLGQAASQAEAKVAEFLEVNCRLASEYITATCAARGWPTTVPPLE